jgi:hypothetical protein
MEKLTVRLGRVRDGDSLTGNFGTKKIPTIAKHKKMMMMVKEDMYLLFDI